MTFNDNKVQNLWDNLPAHYETCDSIADYISDDECDCTATADIEALLDGAQTRIEWGVRWPEDGGVEVDSSAGPRVVKRWARQYGVPLVRRTVTYSPWTEVE